MSERNHLTPPGPQQALSPKQKHYNPSHSFEPIAFRPSYNLNSLQFLPCMRATRPANNQTPVKRAKQLKHRGNNRTPQQNRIVTKREYDLLSPQRPHVLMQLKPQILYGNRARVRLGVQHTIPSLELQVMRSQNQLKRVEIEHPGTSDPPDSSRLKFELLSVRLGLTCSWNRISLSDALAVPICRSENLAENKMTRGRLESGRCCLIVNGYFVQSLVKDDKAAAATSATEPSAHAGKRSRSSAAPKRKQVHYVTLLSQSNTPDQQQQQSEHQESQLMFLAAIFDEWRDPVSGLKLHSAAMLTIDACEEMKQLNPRMPVILNRNQAEQWCDTIDLDFASVHTLLRPRPANDLSCVRVSTHVLDVNADGAMCIQPEVEPAKEAQRVKQQHLESYFTSNTNQNTSTKSNSHRTPQRSSTSAAAAASRFSPAATTVGKSPKPGDSARSNSRVGSPCDDASSAFSPNSRSHKESSMSPAIRQFAPCAIDVEEEMNDWREQHDDHQFDDEDQCQLFDYSDFAGDFYNSRGGDIDATVCAQPVSQFVKCESQLAQPHRDPLGDSGASFDSSLRLAGAPPTAHNNTKAAAAATHHNSAIKSSAQCPPLDESVSFEAPAIDD